MNHIDRCKKAQELGLRVQFKNPESPTNQKWPDHALAWNFNCDPAAYRIHPDDEKAFDSILKLEQANDRITALANAHNEQLQINQELQNRVEALKERGKREQQRIQDQIGVINELQSRITPLKKPTADDLLQQLRQKLGLNATITIVVSGV